MKYDKGAFAAYAKADLEQMECNAKNGFFPALSTCMHAQQYAEKMLKEKLVEFGNDPRFEHNLVTILNELETIGIPMTEDIYAKASILSNYYMAARYPGYRDFEFGEETAEEAYCFALDVVSYADGFYIDEDGNIRSNKQDCF